MPMAARVAGRQKIPTHLPWAPEAGGGEGHRIAAEAQVEPVDRPHQRDAARIVRLVEQPFLHHGRRMEIEQHDAGFLVAVAAASDRGEAGERGADQLAAVACRNGQMHRPRRVMLRVLGFEAIGLDKHHQVRRRQMLPAQLFGRTRRVR
jgi:hypothetical protein